MTLHKPNNGKCKYEELLFESLCVCRFLIYLTHISIFCDVLLQKYWRTCRGTHTICQVGTSLPFKQQYFKTLIIILAAMPGNHSFNRSVDFWNEVFISSAKPKWFWTRLYYITCSKMHFPDPDSNATRDIKRYIIDLVSIFFYKNCQIAKETHLILCKHRPQKNILATWAVASSRFNGEITELLKYNVQVLCQRNKRYEYYQSNRQEIRSEEWEFRRYPNIFT